MSDQPSQTQTRRALVTGAAGGIGFAIAEKLADEGWRVLGVDLENPKDETFFENFITGDIANEETWLSLAGQMEDDGLGLLVNAAALQVCGPLIETAPIDWDRVMAVNVKAHYLAVRALHGALAKGQGAVVAISSVHQIATSKNIAAYAASKGAVGALVRAMAIELAEDGIRVNAVAPGAVDTEMLRAGLGRGYAEETTLEEQLAGIASRTVIKRVGKPEEIAEAVLFLGDNQKSSFMTGETMVVDGGVLSRLSTE